MGEDLSQPSENQLKVNPDKYELLPSIFMSKHLAVNCAEDRTFHKYSNERTKEHSWGVIFISIIYAIRDSQWCGSNPNYLHLVCNAWYDVFIANLLF